MYVTAPTTVETSDIAADVETALSIARSLYDGYFEDLPKDEMRQLIGAVVDYIRSAQTLIDAYDKQQNPQRVK